MRQIFFCLHNRSVDIQWLCSTAATEHVTDWCVITASCLQTSSCCFSAVWFQKFDPGKQKNPNTHNWKETKLNLNVVKLSFFSLLVSFFTSPLDCYQSVSWLAENHWSGSLHHIDQQQSTPLSRKLTHTLELLDNRKREKRVLAESSQRWLAKRWFHSLLHFLFFFSFFPLFFTWPDWNKRFKSEWWCWCEWTGMKAVKMKSNRGGERQRKEKT